MKTTVLHFIESLNRGGAEVLLVSYLNSLPAKYNNIVVYMGEPSTMRPELRNVSKVYNLQYKSKKNLPAAIIKLTKIIRDHNVSLIHSHLYWPTIIARLALKGNVPLIFSVHGLMSFDAFGPNILSKYLEILTHSKNETAVFVSEAAATDYQNHITFNGRKHILYNAVKSEFFSAEAQKPSIANSETLRLVSVGNLKPQKNHLFLVKSIAALANQNISLDIYGEGWQRAELEEFIKKNAVTNVRLLGSHPAPEEVLKDYDVFVFASLHEGFCIAMAEAMAVGLPCIVSDLDALREVSANKQLYFNPYNTDEFIVQLLKLKASERLRTELSENARVTAKKYTIEAHVQQLVTIYESVLHETGA
ncbi:glycosyltransferase family 4 protein [Pontibacter sp. H259]|uniref:glycosyltransferase family 4 protein n=1 Tax=Pontibacter sp. H259 TaxID=3133421 RepID=UPI0030BD477B